MVFTDASAAHRVQHDTQQIYEAIARLLSKIQLDGLLQQTESLPRIDIEVEDGPTRAMLEGQPIPALDGQASLPLLAGQAEPLRLNGRDPDALPYREGEPISWNPTPPSALELEAIPVRVQLGDAVIERPLKLIPEALEEFQPDRMAILRQQMEYPGMTRQDLAEHTKARIEVDGIERFAVTDGWVRTNEFYPAMVGIQAEAIAQGQAQATPEQVENLSRYLLQNQSGYLFVGDAHHQVTVTEQPEAGVLLDVEDLQPEAEPRPADSQADLNLAYQLLARELEHQHIPEMQLRPVAEVESTTGQQLGNIEALHSDVLTASPVVLVSVDDLGRPMVTSSVVGPVEVTEDEVETQSIHQDIQSRMEEEQSMDISGLEYLQAFFEQTGARELESHETGMLVQHQNSELVASTPDGRSLSFDNGHVETNFTAADLQHLNEIAQEATLVLATHEISVGTVQHFHHEMEQG